MSLKIPRSFIGILYMDEDAVMLNMLAVRSHRFGLSFFRKEKVAHRICSKVQLPSAWSVGLNFPIRAEKKDQRTTCLLLTSVYFGLNTEIPEIIRHSNDE